MKYDIYILVEWPECQEFMEEDWFREEAVLAIHDNIGDSAYFIPKIRFDSFMAEHYMDTTTY